MNFKECYKSKIKEIDNRIESYLDKYTSSSHDIIDAMKYSVLNGGKRLRSILCTEICTMLGGKYEDAVDYAIAIELIHAYSLVHDDLPAMDNADMRRGQPSCHKKFGEAFGILCGDALLNSAFELMLSKSTNADKLRAAACIAEAAGVSGMINGQVLDLKLGSSSNADEKTLIRIVEQKTMALIKASVLAGAYIAGADNLTIDKMTEFSYNLGLAFQIRDDFEDIHEDEKAQSDCPNFINALGAKKAQEQLDLYSKNAYNILSEYDKNEFLISLHKYLFE